MRILHPDEWILVTGSVWGDLILGSLIGAAAIYWAWRPSKDRT